MKKRFKILILLLTSVTLVTAQQHWVTYKIDNRLSVKLPSEPKQIQEGTVLSMQKDTIVCVVTVLDFLKSSRMDSAAFVKAVPTQQFADEVKAGMLSQMQGFTLGEVKVGTWRNHTTYIMQGEQAAQKLNDFTYMIIIGRYMYSISALIPQGKSTVLKDYLFNSLVEN